MSFNCNSCECELDDDEIRWAYDLPYCINCFYENYNTCCNCGTTMDSDNTFYNDDGDTYCDDCYEYDYDPNCPDDPNVEDSDRELVINLCKNWLKNKSFTKSLLRINSKDHQLPLIRSKIGFVDRQIYIYGLIDRDEYQIKASPAIFNLVSQYVSLNNWDVTLAKDSGANRLGISYSIRNEKQEQLISLIKEITYRPQIHI